MTESTFLAAILADPANDGPRLAFADWLMERGDARGEFIAVQCRIAAVNRELQTDEDCGGADFEGCVERRQLLTKQHSIWLTIPFWISCRAST